MVGKTFRLFISSTFNDFLIERDLLNERVYPIVNSYCVKQGYDFQLVDLRWGVSRESSYRQNTIDICLEEVRRCRMLSPKPNLLLLIGERYGWVAIPAVISAADFDLLVSSANDEEKALLKYWYLEDRNSISGIYCLRDRQGKYKDEALWRATEANLRSVLQNLAEKSGVSGELISSITTSATEKEIEEGLFKNNDLSDNTIAFFRTGFSDRSSDTSQVERLKSRVSDKLEESSNADRIIRMEFADDEEYRRHFAEYICDLLINTIDKEIERLREEKESITPRMMMESHLNPDWFIDARRKTLSEIEAYISSDIRKPLYLVGESGSGKTTALAELIKEYEGDSFFAFYGLYDDSFSLVPALRSIVNGICEAYDTRNTVTLTGYNIAEAFHETINSVPEGKKALIVVDGLDMFQDIDSINENIFPEEIPSNVKLIVSSAEREVVEKYSGAEAQYLEIGEISEEESRDAIIKMLELRGRSISAADQQSIISNALSGGCSPLKIKLITDFCSKWRSFDRVVPLASSIEELALQYLESMFELYGHSRSMCLYTYAMMNAAPYGIMEGELLDLLLSVSDVREDFSRQDLYEYKKSRLPFAVWSRLFYDLQDCASLQVSYGKTVVKFKHSIFGKVVSEKYSEICSAASSVLTDHYESLAVYIDDEETPDTRKAVMLPYLLRISGDVKRMSELYSDVDFIDSIVKTGKLDELISDLQSPLINGADRGLERLGGILACMNDNYDLLNCYRDRSKQCLSEWELCEGDKFLIAKKTRSYSPDMIRFKYSKSAKVVKNDDGSRIAVFSGSYVYICEFPSMHEYCRIYVDLSRGENREAIESVVWISNNAIAVVTKKKVFAYDFSDGAATLRYSIEHSKPFVDAAREQERLVIIDHKVLKGVDIRSGNVVYTISDARAFYIDHNEGALFVLKSSKKLLKHDVKTGAMDGNGSPLAIKTSKDNLRITKWMSRFQGDRWVLDSARLLIYLGPDSKSAKYLKIPLPIAFPRALVGERYIVYCYSSFIFIVDVLDEFTIHYISVPGAVSCSWDIMDESVLVICEGGMLRKDLADMRDTDEAFSKCPVMSSSIDLEGAGNILVYLSNYLPNPGYTHAHDYNRLFPEENLDRENASLIVFANDGKIAVAYESQDMICVYGNDHRPLIRIDKLALSIFNNILKISFSEDSSELLIWRNYSIQAINISKAKLIANIDIRKTPAWDVKFSADSEELEIWLCDGEQYRYSLEKKAWIGKKLPKTAAPVDPDFKDAYQAVYKAGLSADGDLISCKFCHGVADDGASPYKAFENIRFYWDDDLCMYLSDGRFTLDGNPERTFDQPYFDFDAGFQKERALDWSYMDSFLREKNDVMSRLYTLEDGKHLILVARSLRSVISFNIEEQKIVTLHNLHADIIGDRFNEEGELEIYCNQRPYKTVYVIKGAMGIPIAPKSMTA